SPPSATPKDTSTGNQLNGGFAGCISGRSVYFTKSKKGLPSGEKIAPKMGNSGGTPTKPANKAKIAKITKGNCIVMLTTLRGPPKPACSASSVRASPKKVKHS